MNFVLLWLGLSIAIAVGASRYGRSGIGFFVLSIALSPVIGLAFLLALGRKGLSNNQTYFDPAIGRVTAIPQASTKTCPDCAEDVKTDARICRFCGHRFYPSEPVNSEVGQPVVGHRGSRRLRR